MYLVDTSVWIDFLRGRESKKVDFLERLLEEGDAHVCEIVYAELCFGADNAKQLQKYETLFSAIPFLELPRNWHRQVGEMGFKLRRSGYTPFVADLMIGLAALHHQAILLTTDSDFDPYQELFDLRLE